MKIIIDILIDILIYIYLIPLIMQSFFLSSEFYRRNLFQQFLKAKPSYNKFNGDFTKYCRTITFTPIINIIITVLSIMFWVRVFKNK